MLARLSTVSVLLLGACAAVPPSGPAVLAVPGPGKTLAQFQQDDFNCRNYAQATIGPITPAQAGTNSAVGSTVAGTAIGAAAGALIGAAAGNAGAGAAIGAGSGLLVGAGAGASNAQLSSGALQQRYDYSYIQCMTAAGQNVQTATAVPYAAATPYPAYGYPAYAYPPVVVGPPVIGLGIGFGGGGYYRRPYWGRPYW